MWMEVVIHVCAKHRHGAIWSSGYSSSVTVVQWKWTEGRGGVLLDITCCGVAGLGQRGTR